MAKAPTKTAAKKSLTGHAPLTFPTDTLTAVAAKAAKAAKAAPAAKVTKAAPAAKVTEVTKVTKAPAPPAAEPAHLVPATAHGVTLTFGDTKKGGTSKSTLMTMMDRKAIKIVKGFNPRSVIGSLDTLADSIKREGLLSALVVRPSAKAGEFDLVCGERRLRASEIAGRDLLPVIIRTDLAGDDAAAKAAAVAENSEDVRTNLNPIEMGQAFTGLAKDGWSVQKMATDCGVHIAKVRRCLSLMEAPEDVRKRVASGEMSATTGLEVAKLDPATRKAIADQLKGDLSGADVRKLAKTVAQETAPDGATPDGKQAQKKAGAQRDAALIVWRPAKAKQAAMQRLCHLYVNATDEEKNDDEYLEIRGALGVMLWDRGDMGELDFLLPAQDTDDPAELKLLKRVDATIAREAKKYAAVAEAEAEADEAEKTKTG